MLSASTVALKVHQTNNNENAKINHYGNFNLLSDYSTNDDTFLLEECTLELINTLRLQQDHPCVINQIRVNFLHNPSTKNYNLSNPGKKDPSVGQSSKILRSFGLRKKKIEGIFIEAGALDGEHLSNTLYMERFLNWTGILIEADPKSYALLLEKNRKSYSLPICLSLVPYPTRVNFKSTFAMGSIQEKNHSEENDDDIVQVQCFPLYSIMLAVNKTAIDFLSLDIEGSELRVIRTIPWHKVDIKTLSIEWERVGHKTLITELQKYGYYNFDYTEAGDGKDLLFKKTQNFPKQLQAL